MSPLLTYALDSNNQLVHVDSVAQGSACQCHCPHCKAPLDAKNGGHIREHHFAHAHGQNDCKKAFESALHLMAKQVIQERGGVMLPDSEDASRPSGFVELRDLKVETMDERYGIKPDVEGIMPDGRRLLIECLVTHKISEKKYKTIVENDLVCIEIDFNYLELSKEVLEQFITQDSTNRKWIIRREKTNFSDGHGSIQRKNPLHIKVQGWLKDAFDLGLLSIKQPRPRGSKIIYTYRHLDFYSHQIIDEDITYNLREYGYDTCEVDTNYLGFKSNLLLSRSQKLEKGFISINIRGKRRSCDFRYPNGLRIIDIIVRDEGDLYYTSSEISQGILSKSSNIIEFLGDWKKA